MVGIVGMTGIVAAVIVLIVAWGGIHIYPSVPVITYGIRCFVEEQVICRSSKTAAGRGFLHAVAHNADIMRWTRNITMDYT